MRRRSRSTPSYQQAHRLAEHRVLDAAGGFPGADDRLAAWLHAQCLLFGELRNHSAGLLLTLLLAEQSSSHPSLTVPGEAAGEGAAGLHTRIPAHR
ncbi:hypothetical protein [Streptomyces sp. NBC_00273]|uniref:hypothetical protein n=1 Tax=Streptomyces sp. NBC_00273 TaxID=2903644 RepID=UPI002E28B0EC|nr:hypothetical protein [Streptomyces sp. NBC_00273]